MTYLEKLKGRYPFVTRQFLKRWKNGTMLVVNQRMEVIEEIITDSIGLKIEGINFYRDKKMSNRVMDEFVELAKERKRLVKVSNSYFCLIVFPNLGALFYFI